MNLDKIININLSRRTLLKQFGFVCSGALFLNTSILPLNNLNNACNSGTNNKYNELSNNILHEQIHITPYQKNVITTYLS